MNPVNQYLNELAKYYSDSSSSEMSYRTSFQNYLATIFTSTAGYTIQHDPKAVGGNKPDFIVLKNHVPLLYIEVKDPNAPGSDLDKIEKSDQATRYFGYTNLIISDYAEFRFYRNGVSYSAAQKLATLVHSSKTIHQHPDTSQSLAATMHEFVASQKEPIKSGKHLAKIMGGKAQRIRDNVLALFATDNEQKNELEKMQKFIENHLIANFTTEDFADMYAQTLVYGLFAARYNDTTLGDFTRQEARELVPATNPFLKSFFDHISGTSFPSRLEIIVNELCEVFSHADVATLMEEYFKQLTLDGGAVESPDPVIHFYEDFLREYNPKKKMEMGVFYTPLPVVRFIVRGIDELLKREFGITRGLADNQTIKVERRGLDKKGKSVSVRFDTHRVQILDVAVGTGTFLNETVNFIHDQEKHNQGRWTAYVNDHLLPRLHGFELMMASYTIAHLKLAMTLTKSGVDKFEKRLGVYLTNTLDEAHEIPFIDSLFGVVESISLESKLASEVKRDHPIMVVLGNPPYSGISQNKHYTNNNVYKVEPGGTSKLNERKHWLDDDYVKFIRFAESMVEKNGEGIIAMITAHGYIDNPTFRGMRWHLRKTFDAIYVVDLHGNSNKKETAPDGTADKNVFDIKTGVSMIFGVKKRNTDDTKKPLATVYQTDFYGSRASKFKLLDEANFEKIDWNSLQIKQDIWKVEGRGKDEYLKGFLVTKLFPENSTGIVTAIDKLAIFLSEEELISTTRNILTSDNPYSEFGIKDQRKNKKENRILELHQASQEIPTKISYRPYDVRYLYYTKKTECWMNSPRYDLMKHFLHGPNIGLVFARTQRNPNWNAVFISSLITETKLGEASTQSAVAPLYLYTETGEKIPNLDAVILEQINTAVGTSTPEDVFDYIYAVLHSPNYRTKYSEFLKSDFPRIPYPTDKQLFWKLVEQGRHLRELHLLIHPDIQQTITRFPESGNDTVEKISFLNGRVYINDMQYWDGVPEAVWQFYIGGYQPAQKYLKDRKGRKMTTAEFENYEKMITSLNQTIKVMKHIDTLVSF